MALVTIEDLSIGFRGPPLLDQVNCQIESGQRIGLLGRNGAGKTTLMRMLCGNVEPDHGTIKFAPQTRVALLPQGVPQDIEGSIAEIIAKGWAMTSGEALAEVPDWEREQSVERVMSKMQLTDDTRFESLSSGMKRRVLLAQSLVADPDLLLLDEPTNHLDIDAITWLEGFLSRWSATLVFVTHDRMFLRNIADRILEIDRGRLFDWSCDYETFLRRKDAALEAEEKQNALFDKKLAQEEAWIRQGIKARRTRNEGRVKALKRLREEHSHRRTTPTSVKLKIDAGGRSGNLVAEVKNVSFAYGPQDIFRDFSVRVMRGDKLGIIGPNGAGKTTLLRVLLGDLKPDQGKVRLGTNLQIAYFDQLREQLNEDQTVQENVGDGSDTVQVGGRSKHVIGYLNDFLFSPERARTPVRFLSGGERNRILLARLFAKPANVIVLDEPTNDLDAETLEMLEQRLVDFEGTILLVSHDREFLNRVVTSTVVFEPEGLKEYDGGYDDWQRQRAEQQAAPKPDSKSARPEKRETQPTPSAQSRRLTFKEQQELSKLPGDIEALEKHIARLHETMASPDFYRSPGDQIASANAELAELESKLANLYSRWEDLEHSH